MSEWRSAWVTAPYPPELLPNTPRRPAPPHSKRCSVEELRTLFGRAGTAGEIELYPGVHHGFAFPQRWCYDKPAAERHWERLIALYRRRLAGTR